jgi:hypothetical protein
MIKMIYKKPCPPTVKERHEKDDKQKHHIPQQ